METSTRDLALWGGAERRLASSLPPVSQLSRKCGNLDILQPCWPLQPVNRISLPFTVPKTNDNRIINETAEWISVKSDIAESALKTNFVTVHMV
jgi:hypothetical protein